MSEEARIDSAARAVAERIMWSLYPHVEIDGGAGLVTTGRARFAPEPEHVGAPGWVQGGLSATVLDFVCARLASAALDMRTATGTFDLRYRQPVMLEGGPYVVEGSTEEPKSRSVRVHAAIVSPQGRPLVEASGLFVGIAPL